MIGRCLSITSWRTQLRWMLTPSRTAKMSSLAASCSTSRRSLYASYAKVEPPLKLYARGLSVFDDDKQEFVPAGEVPMIAPTFPTGHAFRHSDGGIEYVYFARPFPFTRIHA